MKRSHLRMEGDLPFSPAVPDDLPEAEPIPPPAPAVVADEPGLARSLPAAEEVDIPAQIQERDRIAAEAEDPFGGFIAGGVAALLAVGMFGGIAAGAGCSFKFLSVGSGVLVALAVRRFGRGRRALFSVMGAGWAAAGCIGACLVACAFAQARRAELPVLDYLQAWSHWSVFVHRSFGLAEVLWCLAAMVCGYMFARATTPDGRPRQGTSPPGPNPFSSHQPT